jgi:hydroxyacylglutathione hydrolase
MKIHSIRAGIANVHLLHDGRGVVIVDAGWNGYGRKILSAISRLGYHPKDVRLILLTHVHADHVGSAAELKRLTGAPVAIHRGDAGYAEAGWHHIPTGRGWMGVSSKWLADRVGFQLRFEPFAPDVWLEEGQTLSDFGLEGYVIHTPGHTQGSVTLALEDGLTLIGDALINMFKVGYPMYWENAEQGRESGRKIQKLKPRVIYSGHGRAFGGDELDRYLELRKLSKSHD